MLEKVWNGKLAHHPLNWLILLVIAILGMYLIDSLHTLSGARKPVSDANARNARKRANPNLAAGVANMGYGTSSYTPDSYVPT